MHSFKGGGWGDHAHYLVAILCKTLGLFFLFSLYQSCRISQTQVKKKYIQDLEHRRAAAEVKSVTTVM